LIKQSFLKEYQIRVIYNGVDLKVFRPIQSERLREKYSLDNRHIILGVANEWTEQKG